MSFNKKLLIVATVAAVIFLLAATAVNLTIYQHYGVQVIMVAWITAAIAFATLGFTGIIIGIIAPLRR